MIDSKGRNIGFDFNNVIYEDISTSDYDPLTDATKGDGEYEKGWMGFYIIPNDTGYVYAITHQDWLDNKQSLTGLTPVKIFTVIATPLMVRLVKVYAANDSCNDAIIIYKK